MKRTRETDGYYYFNRCRRCNTMITKLQILAAFRKDGVICACGGGTFAPTNPLWHEWFTPRAFKMIVWQLLGWMAPAPEPSVLPPIPVADGLAKVEPLSAEEVRPPEEGEA